MIPIKQFLQHKKKALIIVLIYSIPVVFYVIYLMWFFKSNPELVTDSQSAFKLQWTKYLHNFKNTSYSIQTFLSFYSVIALPIFLLISSSIQIKDNINKAFWFTFFLNSLIIFITVYAEESRVFTLPFLLVYPILGKIIIDQYKWEKAFLTYLIKPLNIIIIVCVSVGAWLMFDKLYELTNLICYENLYREYNTLVVLFMTVLLLNTWYKKRLISNSNYSR